MTANMYSMPHQVTQVNSSFGEPSKTGADAVSELYLLNNVKEYLILLVSQIILTPTHCASHLRRSARFDNIGIADEQRH